MDCTELMILEYVYIIGKHNKLSMMSSINATCFGP